MLVVDDFLWDAYFWKASIVVSDDRLAGGPVPLVFAPEGRGEGPITADELALLRIAEDGLDAMVALAAAALYVQYSSLQAAYDYDEQDRASFMPDLNSAEEIYDLINVVGVNVHPVSRDGMPYVGIEFDTRWDPEHGAGALINGKRRRPTLAQNILMASVVPRTSEHCHGGRGTTVYETVCCRETSLTGCRETSLTRGHCGRCWRLGLWVAPGMRWCPRVGSMVSWRMQCPLRNTAQS
jgi:hypothetical protein